MTVRGCLLLLADSTYCTCGPNKAVKSRGPAFTIEAVEEAVSKKEELEQGTDDSSFEGSKFW